jgi:predicted transcriptional regulator
MPKDAMFSFKLEPELHEQFMTAAAAADRPASQLVREFMRDFIKRQQEANEQDSWFRAQVVQGLAEADDPTVKRIPNDEVEASWRARRAALVERLRERDE